MYASLSTTERMVVTGRQAFEIHNEQVNRVGLVPKFWETLPWDERDAWERFADEVNAKIKEDRNDV